MPAKFNEDDISRMADELAEFATSPQLLSALEAVRQSPSEVEALSEARRVASLDYLISRGLKPPATFRITTRYFEPPELAPLADARENLPLVAFENGRLTVTSCNGVVSVEEMVQMSDVTVKPRGVIRVEIKDAINSIGQFVCQPEFQAMLSELYALDETARPSFVLRVVLNEGERKKRGIAVPNGMVIQRSTFADDRPTLFCVTQHTPLAWPWDKVTVTFDQPALLSRAAKH
ncbi:hypothetical protein [Bradyrhizobium sp. AUGA SZCCT0283]|uniref:hypothetical protein n=1 Tax=Bradyrhizobium sp. AUGA SZCCT0283 TaxID=2807671 RepID=UPI001BAE418F|nr:hypothetical protein [Bradyrhizobium sp. AUGA SZCCT0283]MBR1274274.1 hypothetical protein [Bradyrhizobium sp. AUGA SZCCT0283]